MKQDKIVELYRGELWECQLLESILKDNNIDCFFDQQYAQRLWSYRHSCPANTNHDKGI